ncbi:hypothetical protein DFJ74DRAFT_712401 [Hyaloraphidium curvatum]|nr:hypothetical protein DFJ74DRAFT_712401 [Hyaloraphidium curvatum]
MTCVTGVIAQGHVPVLVFVGPPPLSEPTDIAVLPAAGYAAAAALKDATAPGTPAVLAPAPPGPATREHGPRSGQVALTAQGTGHAPEAPDTVLKSLDNGSGGYQELYNSMFQGQAQAVLVDTLGLHWDELPDTQFSPSELVFAVDGHYPHADDFLRAVAPVVPNRPAYVRHFVYICHLLFGTGGSLRATRESLLLCVQRAGLWGATAEVLDSMTALASDEDFLAMLSRYGDADDAV